MTNQMNTPDAPPKHAYLVRGKDGTPLKLERNRIRQLVSPLPVEGDPSEPDGLRITADGMTATVRQIRQGMVVTLSPELEWEEVSQFIEPYLEEVGQAVGQELEVVEL